MSQTAPAAPIHIRPAILAPTFNNAQTLMQVLTSLEALGLPIIVVNDGSSDATAGLLDAWRQEAGAQPRIVLTHGRNRGKAAALRTGFGHAAEQGYTHALTIDTDGQHDVADVPALLAAAAAQPEALVLGARAGGAAAAPGRHRLGRTASDWLAGKAAGTRISDSQSGLRIYPLAMFERVRCRAQRYTFETEVVIRAAWAGLPIAQVPIAVRYLPRAQRVSHFRPCLDSARWAWVILGLLLRAASGRRKGAAGPADRLSEPVAKYRLIEN